MGVELSFQDLYNVFDGERPTWEKMKQLDAFKEEEEI